MKFMISQNLTKVSRLIMFCVLCSRRLSPYNDVIAIWRGKTMILIYNTSTGIEADASKG